MSEPAVPGRFAIVASESRESAQKAAEGWKEQFAVEFRKVDDSK